MIVRIVPLLSFIAVPRVLGPKKATTIVTRGRCSKDRFREKPEIQGLAFGGSKQTFD
jgi:hypothetical protein